MNTSVNIKIGGQAGEGIKTTGLILSKSLTRLGFNIYAYDEYPSLIRGGHNCFQVLADHAPVFSQRKKLDCLVALDKQSISLHKEELKRNAFVLFDPDEFSVEDKSLNLVPIPWSRLAKESGGLEIMANMVSLGAVLALCGIPVNTLNELTSEIFAKKGREIVDANKKAIKAGEEYIIKNNKKPGLGVELPQQKDLIVVLGNEAIGAAAIASGLKYYAAYPMTPATSLLHFLAKEAENFNIVVNHAENEISAVITAIGASAAGARSMTATSGGGFSLMTEGLGFAGMAEIPLVIVLSMRPGPASGMPTWTGQGDLRYAIHASQDEFPRIILTPGDPFEAFTLTKKAFILSEKYQLPAIILTDKVLAESFQSGQPFDVNHQNQRYAFVYEPIGVGYKRYKITMSGVSPRPLLGQSGGASIIANSYEHGQDSLATEDKEKRKEQMEKRLRKLDLLKSDLWELPIFGASDADTTLVGFGTTAGPIREALKDLPGVNYLHFNYVWPFPEEQVKKVLSKAKRAICVEANSQGQLKGLIFEQTGIKIEESLRKYDGRPFWPEEIKNKIKDKK